MAKVIITIEDEGDGSVGVESEFDPPLPADKRSLEGAQKLGFTIALVVAGQSDYTESEVP